MTETQVEPFAARIGAAIKAGRYDQGKTTAELAEQVGVTDRYVRYLERGEAMPSAPLYRKISDALGIALPSFTEAP